MALITPSQYLFNPNEQPTAHTPIIQVNNTTIATLGNVITMSGRSGVRKSTFLHMFVGSYLINKKVCKLQILPPNDSRDKIVLIDTEQSAYSLYNQVQRLRRQINVPEINTDKLIIYRLRSLTHEDVKKFLHTIIEHHKHEIFLICIDNILDMVLNYNDVSESKLLIDDFKNLTDTYNIILFSIIHQSKQTAFSIGHTGSRLEALAQTSLRVQYTNHDTDHIDKNISELIVGEKIRDSEEFTPIRIKYDSTKDFYVLN